MPYVELSIHVHTIHAGRELPDAVKVSDEN